MQIIILVACYGGPSLRDTIAKDPKIADYDLQVSEQKRQGRPGGWTKVHGTQCQYGAINIQWDPATCVLSCRVVTRKPGKPNAIIGSFIAYLVARHRRRIYAINVYPE